MADGGLVVYYPKLPCGRLPVYCTSRDDHTAHDHGPEEGPHAGGLFWHCYGIYRQTDELPEDAVLEDCGHGQSTQMKEEEPCEGHAQP